MNEIELKKIKLDEKIIDITKLRNTFDNREWKAYILFQYKDNKIKFRDKIEIITEKNNLQEGKCIIKLPKSVPNTNSSRKTIIGTGILKDNIITELKLYINNKKDSNNQYDLFRFLNEEELNKRKKYQYQNNNIEEYANSIFKIYYDHIKYYINKFSDYQYKQLKRGSRNKATAMASYLSIRDYLLNNYKSEIQVSESNVFIKNNFTEYDFLILKKETAINQGCYDEKDVYAAVEIKTSGFFPSKSTRVKSEFKELIKKETSNLNIPLLYISIHEGSSRGRKNSKANYLYETILDKISEYKNKVYGLFVAIKVDNNQFVIPYDFNLDNIITEIIKEKEKNDFNN